MTWSLFIFRRHSTREPASIVTMSEVTYFILWANEGTGVSHSGEVLEKMQVNDQKSKNKQRRNPWQ